MAEISKITLPSGNTYDIKDSTARQMIAGGVSFIVAWDGTGTAVAANIPKGVKAGSVTGTLEAADAQSGAFYLVKSSSTPSSETLDIYDEYAVIGSATKSWEKLGDTKLNLTDVVTGVSLTKQTDTVLGEATTFTNGSSSVTFTGGTTDTFVKSVSVSKGDKLVTTTITPTNGTETVPNVTSAGTASTWDFTMGSGSAAETLVISGANGTAPTLGTAKTVAKAGTAVTVATGQTSASGTGSAVVSDVTVGSSGSAVTDIGTGTAAAQTITVGTNDKVTVLKDTTDVNVTKGNA